MDTVETPELGKAVTGLWIVLGAMAIGVAAFAAVAAMMQPARDANPEFARLLGQITLGASAAGLIAGAVMFLAQGKRLEATTDAAQRLQVFRTRVIATVAPGEGAALLACVSVLLTGERLVLLPGLAAFAVCLALVVPTPARVQRDLGLREQRKGRPKGP